MDKNYDFAGWAARNDVLCSDGTTIRHGAFAHQDGEKVRLVWEHEHGTPHGVVGHGILENRDEGIYLYGYLNNSPAGQDAKEAIRHKDVDSLSIYANKVKFGGKTGKDVLHGMIREVSLVLTGADPTARIDYVLEHDEEAGEGIIAYNGLVQDFEIPGEDEVSHMEDNREVIEHSEESLEDIINSMSDKQRDAMYAMVGMAIKDTEMAHADKEDDNDEETLEDIINTMTDKQKNAMYAMIGLALEDAGETKETKETNTKESKEDEGVKHNIFEEGANVIQHGFSESDVENIFKEAKRGGSLREAVNDYIEHSDTIAHSVTDDDNNTVTYGMANIANLYPDYHPVTNTPIMVQRDQSWVSKVMNGVRKSPFARIKSILADITMDDARALGYTKGNLKKEEVFKLLKRTTDPQTIYKKQKLDRDDVLDITDFDVVAWLKGEMQVMLEEEKARAILVGDGRSDVSDDKIGEDHIRPVWTDADTYTIKSEVSFTGLATNGAKADAIIDAAIRARKDYKGSGNPTFFAPESTITEMLLIKDTTGRKIYNGISDLATALRVKEIVSVPVMENLSRTSGTGNDAKTLNLLGVIFNPDDYTVGGNKPGQKKLFEDFDIDYNQMKYLIEDRISGALTKPYSAIALETTGTFAVG